MTNYLERLGAKAVEGVAQAGHMQLFCLQAIWGILRPPYRCNLVVRQIHFIGVRSWLVILLTAVFTGMVLSLQGYYSLRHFGSEALLGSGVALSLIRELAPVLAALMVTGRAGSAMAAELGIMRITEQIDALATMNLEPVKFLVSPRLLASVIAVPLLTAIFAVLGITGGYIVAVHLLSVNPGVFYRGMVRSIQNKDLWMCFIKAFIFGATVGIVCAYKGFTTGFGAEGVGRATTSAVVLSSVLILIWDYVLTSIMM